MKGEHTVAGTPIANIAPDCLNCTGYFMAKNLWRGEKPVLDF